MNPTTSGAVAATIAYFVLSFALGIALFWLPGSNLIITALYFVASAVGYAGLALWVGRGLIRSGGAMGAVILGSILVGFIQLVPVLGWFLVWPVFSVTTLGAAILSGLGESVDWLLPRAEAEPIARPQQTA